MGKIPILTNIFQRGWNHQQGLSLGGCPTFVFFPPVDESWKVTFTLGHTPISAWVAFEFDEMLDTFVGTLVYWKQGRLVLQNLY